MIFTGLLATYIGFYVSLEKAYLIQAGLFSEFISNAENAKYWYRAPKDIVSLIACCFLLQFAVDRRNAATVGVAASALSVSLSCLGFYCNRWMPGWFHSEMRIAWSVLGSLTWVLMVCALFYAIRIAPIRFYFVSTTVFICLLATYVAFHVWVEYAYPILDMVSSRAEKISYWYRIPKDIALLVGCSFLFQIAGERRTAAAIGVTVCALSISLSCFSFFCIRWLFPTFHTSDIDFYRIALDSFLWVLIVFALMYAVLVAPVSDGSKVEPLLSSD